MVLESRQSRHPRRLLERFRRNQAGAIAPMFGFVIIPVLTMTVFGVDLSRALTSRIALQDAVDAAGLAIAHMPSNTSQADLNAAANNWIAANLRDTTLSPTVTVTSVNRQITIAASAAVPSLAGGLTNILQIPIKASTTAMWGTKIELALVLDNTGSMAQNNKLVDLKTAASTLVDTLSAATANGVPGALKVGVVPFSDTVNIGSNLQPVGSSNSWLTGTQPAAYGKDLFTTSADRFSLLTKMGVPWGGCVESRPIPYDVQDTAPDTSNPATLFVPFFAPDENDGFWNSGYFYYWYINNYLTDSSSDNGVYGSPSKYKTAPRTGWSGWGNLGPGWSLGPNMGCGSSTDPGLQPILRLTTDVTAVKTKINAMTATGDTHIPIGLMWGWHVLSPNLPFADGASYNSPNVTKVAVLVTDGANTYTTGQNGIYGSTYTGYGYAYQNRLPWSSFPDATSAINDRLVKLCANMKASGVVLYTIPVQVTDTTIKSLLQSCATNPGNYIEVTTSAGMQAAFAQIAGSIGRLRLAH